MDKGASKRTVLIGGICVVGIIVMGVYLALNSFAQSSANGIPSDIVRGSNFQLYYPKQLPVGMTVDKDSFSKTDQVVTFSFGYSRGKHLIVSEQPLTDKTVFDSFNPTKKVTTPIGTAYIVEMDDRVTAAVVGDSSWLIVNSPDKIGTDIMEEFLKNLQPVSR